MEDKELTDEELDNKEKENETKDKEKTVSSNRNYMFDNMKAILLILVVFGHMLSPMIREYDIIMIPYAFTYLFHMPAMVFVSGYFTKDADKARNNAVETILIPYLILNVCSYIYKIYILNFNHYGFRFFRPSWGLWYLFALFIWRFFLKDLIRIRFILPLAFLFGILSGFSKEFGGYMALGRVASMLPFFLLGHFTTENTVRKIRMIPKWISLIAVGLVALFSTYIISHEFFKLEVLLLRKPYPESADVRGMILRMIVYVIALVMTAVLINLSSNKRGILTRIGASTLTVYVLHLFTVPSLEKLNLFHDNPYFYLAYCIAATGCMVFVYSRKFVGDIYNKVIGRLTRLVLRSTIEKKGRI